MQKKKCPQSSPTLCTMLLETSLTDLNHFEGQL